MELKPQDLLVLFKRVAAPRSDWTYAGLGQALHLSASQVHRSVKRCLIAGLAVEHGRGDWQPVRGALCEFAVHGVRYAFPATLGAVKRGIPTSFGAPPLVLEISAAPGDAPVWPHPDGTARGPSLAPLSATAAQAALEDPALYELLSLLDALRVGRARERSLAAQHLRQRLEQANAGE